MYSTMVPFPQKASTPMWSSFPSSQFNRHNSTRTTTDQTTMGLTYSRGSHRHTLLNICRPFTKKTTWDPPSYDSKDYKSPSNTRSSSSDADSRYAFLKDFDTIFLVDDSSSMSGPRWREAEEAIAAIAPICTQYDQDGIDIYFLNHRRSPTSPSDPAGSYTNITSSAGVQEIFQSVRPRGSTPVGRRLLEILTPYLRRVERMQTALNPDGSLRDPSLFVKPVNLITITDGEFTDDAESVIVQVAKTLDSPAVKGLPWQVGIQFFQIGDDEEVRRYLQELDDDLGKWCRDERVRDIVDTVPWRGQRGQTLDAEGILKCVLGAVTKKLDRRVI